MLPSIVGRWKNLKFQGRS